MKKRLVLGAAVALIALSAFIGVSAMDGGDDTSTQPAHNTNGWCWSCVN